MHRRNRVAVFLTMPIAVFIWLIGWTLTYLGSKQKPIKPKASKQEELTFAVLPQEQEILA